MNNQENHPMSEYLLKIQLLVSNTEFKNKDIANQYETVESRLKGEEYVRAKLGTDMFESYYWDDTELIQALESLGYDFSQAEKLIANPSFIPPATMKILLNKKREVRVSNYVESNKYYLNLAGQPYPGSSDVSADPLITVPEQFYELYKDVFAFGPDTFVHELPTKYLELFLSSQYYDALLNEYPDVEYIKHLGSYAIPIEKSRTARDGDILIINTNKLHTYHRKFGDVTVPYDMVHLFTNVYNKVQNYVYNTLRGNFEMIYSNYNSFIRLLTIYLTIGNCLNECMNRSTKVMYMNKATMNDYFMLYGLPSVIMDNSDQMVEFLKKFRLLLMDKGTNTVYRVKDLIGYEYTDIYTLVMVKQQTFKNGRPVYYTDEDGHHKPVQEIVFRRLGTCEDNTSYFKYRDSRTTYTLDEITSGDPRWWNTPEVEEMIQSMNYTLSNSKYIQLSTSMSMDDIWWQTTILLRGLLDNRVETRSINMNIDYNVNGIQQMTLFEEVLVLTIMMNWKHTDFQNRHLQGDMYIPNGTYNGQPACLDELFIGQGSSVYDRIMGLPFQVSSFDFDVKKKDYEWYQSLPYQTYLDPDTFIPMLDSVLSRESGNIGEAIMYDVKSIYKYLVTKLLEAKTIYEFRQVDDAYNKLFLVDPLREQWFDSRESTDDIIMENYGLSRYELELLKNIFVDGTEFIEVVYDESTYRVNPYDILNYDVLTLTEYPFDDNGFVNTCVNTIQSWSSQKINESQSLPVSIKTQYQSILQDKIILDTTNSEYGPRTFEALLLRVNPKLYQGIMAMEHDTEAMILLIKSIIRSLESYTNSKLIALQMHALGESDYIRILKEVITYFKSYMVEFTKDEFRYIFGGPFDRGGNSDMLHLYDENTHIKLHMIPKDVIRLHDVSHANVHYGLIEKVNHFIYDEAIFRIKTTYQKLKTIGFPIWYDNGKRVTQKPFDNLNDDDIVVGTLAYNTMTPGMICIIPKNNVNSDFYYGNTRP